MCGAKSLKPGFCRLHHDAARSCKRPCPCRAGPASRGTGQYARTNTRSGWGIRDLPVGGIPPCPIPRYAHYVGFTYEDRKHQFWFIAACIPDCRPTEVARTPQQSCVHFLPRLNAIAGHRLLIYPSIARVDSLTMTRRSSPAAFVGHTQNGYAIRQLLTRWAPNVYPSLHDTGDSDPGHEQRSLSVLSRGSGVATRSIDRTITNTYTGTARASRIALLFWQAPQRPRTVFPCASIKDRC